MSWGNVWRVDVVVESATRLIESLTPPAHASAPIHVPLERDECEWFLRGVEHGLVEFRECPPDCVRFGEWGVVGPDHFDTPAGAPRHLFAQPVGDDASFNREYVPSSQGWRTQCSKAGYDRDHCSFPRSRMFEAETEFYESRGGIDLQIEAKASASETAALAAAIEMHGTLTSLPRSAVKEIEYVLDLTPRYLWIVGPGSVDPPDFVYQVARRGRLNAAFTPIGCMPAPPETVS